MKALFIHDHPFIKVEDETEIYTSGNLPAKAWDRYLEHFETLTVVGRGRISKNSTNLRQSSRNNVIFELFFDTKGGADYFLNSRKIKNKLQNLIEIHDIVIIRLPSTLGSFAGQISLKLNKKYIVEVVGCTWDSSLHYGNIFIKLMTPYNFLLMKKIIKYSFGALYVTEFFLQKRYPSLAEHTSYGSNVIINKIHNENLEKKLNHLEKRDKGHLKIGMIGDLSVKYKGYDVLFKAISKLKNTEKNVNIKVILVGGGNQSYIKSLIKKYKLKDNLVITGKLKRDEVFAFLDNLDIYVQPSMTEGLPRSIIEAMSRGCPVLASNVAGIPELIPHQYLHKPGDHLALLKDFQELLHNPQDLRRMAETNFDKSKDYLFSKIEQRRSKFFKKISNNI